MRSTIVAACLVAALFSFGCSKKKKKTAPPPPELAVTLIDRGDAPFESLRYSIAPDTVVRSILEIRTADRTPGRTLQSRNTFGVLPGFRLVLRAGPTALHSKGARYVLRVSKAESILPEGVTERETAEVERGIQVLRGMRGRFDLNEQGIVIDADVPWDQGQERIHPRIAITIGNVRSAIATIPLPKEPVGVGAIWEVRRPVRIWSARVTQVIRYQLTDLADDRFRVSVTVDQTAPPQVADLNPKLEMHVRSYEMHANGHALGDLGLPLAVEASLESTSFADIALVSPEETEPLTSSRRSLLRLVSRVEN